MCVINSLALSRMAGVLAQQKDCFKGMKADEKALQIAKGLPKEPDNSQEHQRLDPGSLLVSLTPNPHLGEQCWTTTPHGCRARAAGHLLVKGQAWFSCSSECVLNSKGQRSKRYP